MKPVNNKSLLHFIFEQMEKLNNEEIDIHKAKAQSSFAKDAVRIQEYELKKADIEMKIRSFNIKYGSDVKIRNLEAKDFD